MLDESVPGSEFWSDSPCVVEYVQSNPQVTLANSKLRPGAGQSRQDVFFERSDRATALQYGLVFSLQSGSDSANSKNCWAKVSTAYCDSHTASVTICAPVLLFGVSITCLK